MPLFELPNNTECALTSFVGRTQKSGPHDVPAVSFRLLLKSVPNTMLDMLSKDIRLTAYAPIEGQEHLPGVELVTPILRSKDLKHWAPETCLEGWRVIVSRGIADDSALQMGTCKIDDFKADFHDGGYIDLDFRVGTADIDEEGAGMLWARQKQKVFVTVIKPETPAPVIDGTTEAFERDHPGASAEDLFTGGDDEGAAVEDDEDAGHELEDRLDNALAASDEQPAEPHRGENWPFGTSGETAAGVPATADAEQRELEAGIAQSMSDAGVKPARRGRKVSTVE